MKDQVVIIGASGHGKVIADIILKSGDSVVGFLDDNPTLGDTFIGFPVLGKVIIAEQFKKYKFVIAIGNADVREQIASKLNVEWYTAIHPTAVISHVEVEIEEGTVIMANAVINSGSKVGKHCIINTGAIVEHDNVVGEFSHISVGTKLAGNVTVGRKAWVGIGSQVIQGKKIGEEVMIGAGATVISDIPSSSTAVGCPAKIIK